MCVNIKKSVLFGLQIGNGSNCLLVIYIGSVKVLQSSLMSVELACNSLMSVASIH